ncbi:MAG: methionine biosynthesis protein MetW, partial [Candidatus Gracilibacteria bacterium]
MSKSFYTPIAPSFSRTRHSPWPEFDLLIPYLKTNSTLLDLGCGNGRLYKFLQKHKKVRYLGMDNNKALL